MAIPREVSYVLKSWVKLLQSKCGMWAGRVRRKERHGSHVQQCYRLRLALLIIEISSLTLVIIV